MLRLMDVFVTYSLESLKGGTGVELERYHPEINTLLSRNPVQTFKYAKSLGYMSLNLYLYLALENAIVTIRMLLLH